MDGGQRPPGYPAEVLRMGKEGEFLMPTIDDVEDILGYFRDSWKEPRREGVRTYGMALDDAIARLQTPLRRWPVRNREERTPIDSQKRAIIHERDGKA